MERRDFLKRASVAGVGMMGLPSFLEAAKGTRNIGIQLYTLRDAMQTDPKGVLRKLATYGYKELETYGYNDGKLFGLPVAEFQKEVKSLGMQVVSGHVDYSVIRDDFQRLLADTKMMGQTNIVLPAMAEEQRAELKVTCDVLNKRGEESKKAGIAMGYHNHDFEFKEVEGKLIYDTMLEYLDPKLVNMEMDIYWVVRAGHDPIKYFEKYPGRFTQWHIKDMDKKDPSQNAVIGTGSIDFKSIFAKANLSGMKHFYIEQETYAVTPIESAEQGIAYLKKIV